MNAEMLHMCKNCIKKYILLHFTGHPHVGGNHPCVRVLLDPPADHQCAPECRSGGTAIERDGEIPQDGIHAHGIS